MEGSRSSSSRVSSQVSVPVAGMSVPVSARKRGRPPIVVTEEVLERRRLARQGINSQRPVGPKSGPVVQGPSRRSGRPAVILTDEVLEQQRLSRQRVNAQRPRVEGPSRKRGRPRGSVNKSKIQHSSSLAPHSVEGQTQVESSSTLGVNPGCVLKTADLEEGT